MIEPGFVASIGIFRMDLSNGSVSEILKASYDFDADAGYYYSTSISPTGRRMAYIFNKDQPIKLNLLDLKTGEINSFPLDNKYTFGGKYRWSEDGTELVFMLESAVNYDHFISITYLDILKEDSMVTFIADKEYHWIISEIEVTNIGVKVSMVDEESLFYDPATGILSSK